MTVALAPPPSVLPLPERQPDAPGQFAFASDQGVRGILRDSGWNGIELRAAQHRLRDAAEGAGRLLHTIGPVGVGLQNADKRTRAQVHGDEVRFIAASGW